MDDHRGTNGIRRVTPEKVWEFVRERTGLRKRVDEGDGHSGLEGGQTRKKGGKSLVDFVEDRLFDKIPLVPKQRSPDHSEYSYPD